MSPQLLWAIAGITISVLTLGAISFSSFETMDTAVVRLTAAEAASVGVAAVEWGKNHGSHEIFTDINAQVLLPYLNGFELSEDGFGIRSKAIPGAVYRFMPNTYEATSKPNGSEVQITLDSIQNIQTAAAIASVSARHLCPSYYEEGQPNIVFWDCKS